ncbi:MAG: hypothetical protein H6Q95_325, partial [Nitrospirae bacterium]|nr:hypothetical protein [Nitrospirota bacterium]
RKNKTGKILELNNGHELKEGLNGLGNGESFSAAYST